MRLDNIARAERAALDFATRAAAKHNNKYDYTRVEYTNCKTAVTIICPIHGAFQQIPNSHLLGHGCSKCGHDSRHLDKITYPRQCSHCDYIAQSPQMYQYHGYTHERIPNGTMCGVGCGQLATIRNTTGNYTCGPTHSCPAYKKQHSSVVTSTWERSESAIRREQLSLRSRNYTPEQRAEQAEKQKITKRKKFGTLLPDDAKSYRHYARYIRERAQRWARKQGHTIGRHTFHVDHKLSINDAWRAGLPEHVVNHPVNLHILEAKANSGKGPNSLLTVDELLTLIEQYDAI